jgi:transposase
VVAGSAVERLLDALLRHCQARKLLNARGRQRTDATHVLAVIRVLNQLECVGEAMRHALNTLAVTAPTWLRTEVPLEWADRYVARMESFRLPGGQAERQALARTIGADGVARLGAV